MEKNKIEQFIDKINAFKQEGKLDLSSGEDLSIAIMNLVSLEEHFFFTGAKTRQDKYYNLLANIREIRKELLKQIVKNPEGEEWCISKHLLAASMRLMEVGTKYYGEGKKSEAEDLFKKAYDLYSLFWGINLKLVNIGEVKNIEENQLNIHSQNGNKEELMGKLNDLVQKLIDCCKE